MKPLFPPLLLGCIWNLKSLGQNSSLFLPSEQKGGGGGTSLLVLKPSMSLVPDRPVLICLFIEFPLVLRSCPPSTG